MLINNMVGYIGKNLNRMNKYQYQIATGKKITVPSDDPVVAARALKLRTDVAEIEQHQRNVKDAISWLDTTEDALANIGDVLQRARELAVQASNGTNTPSDMEKVKEEVDQLRNQIIHLANTTYAGRYIFSGYETDKPLIDEATGNYAIGVSNSEAIKYQIGIGDDIDVNVTGGDLFSYGVYAVAGDKPKMVEVFEDFELALQSGDHQAVSGVLAKLDECIENVIKVRADVGARQNRLELTANRLENSDINFTKLMSENEDIDMAETLIYLQNEENVYRASLAGGARIIMPTLVDFLR